MLEHLPLRCGRGAVRQTKLDPRIATAEFLQYRGQQVASARVAGAETPIKFTRLVLGPRGRLVWYWYWVDGRFTSSRILAKLLEVRAKLLGGAGAAAVISVAADYEDVAAEAAVVLQKFLDQVESPAAALARVKG